VQDALLIGWHEMATAPGHVFYNRLNAVAMRRSPSSLAQPIEFTPIRLFQRPVLMFAVKPLGRDDGPPAGAEVGRRWRNAWRATGGETAVEQALMRGLATA
jgi:hypothetical protein